MTDFIRNMFQSYATMNSNNVKIIHISSENNDMLITLIFLFTIFMITTATIVFLTKNVLHKDNELKQNLENLETMYKNKRKLLSNKNNDWINKKISKIQELISKINIIENDIKKFNLEINNENLIKFNLLKERFFKLYQKLLELDDLSELIIEKYKVILDEYEQSMGNQYEQLQKHFSIQIKENMNKEMSAIKLINNC